MRRSEILLLTLLFFAFILHQVTVPVMAAAYEEGISEGLSSALFGNEKTEEAVPEVITGEEQAAEATIAEELTNEEITEEETSEAVPEVVIEDETVPEIVIENETVTDDETAGESKVPGLKKMESASVETYGVGNTELWSDGLTASLSYAFSGGNGSQDDPYILSTATDLAMLSLNVYSLDGGGYSGKWFRQTADIDLAGKNWFPIGSGVRAFEGNYDGAGHKVKNAKIITSEDQRFNNFSHIGFFGMLSRGSVKDLGIENAYIEIGPEYSNTSSDTGLFVGKCNGGINIDRCYVTGKYVDNGSVSTVGGFMGYENYSGLYLNDCYTIAEIKINNYAKFVGGFCACTYDKGYGFNGLTNSYASTKIELGPSGASEYRYGFYDSTAGTGFYFDTTASRNISYTKMVGTAKSADDLKSASMADTLNGERSGEDAVWAYDADKNAGFPYLKKNAATFESHTVSFDAGSFTTIEAQTIRDNGTAVIPKYIDKNYYISGWYRDQQLTDKYDFATPVIADLVLYAKIEDAKCWTDGLTADLGYAFSGGTGTETEPYLISTPTDLAMLSLNVYELDGYRDYYFRQTCDIDLEGNCWLPIGRGDHGFNGNYDGAGHKVKNAKIITSEDQRFNNFSHIGFFGMLSRGSVKDLGIENAYIEIGPEYSNTSSDTGLFVGKCNGGINIDRCYVTGKYVDNGRVSTVGGFMGYETYSGLYLNDCYAIAEIKINNYAKYVGGFCACTYDKGYGFHGLTNSYASTKIELGPSGASEYRYGFYDSTAGTGFYFDTTASRNISYTKMVGTAKSADDLKSASMADTLNGERSGEDAVWAYDADKNAGFPYLKKTAETFESHTVSFDAGELTTIESKVVPDKMTVESPGFVSKDKYISGWYTDQDLTDEYDFETPVIADMVLYARIEDARCWTDGLTADLGYAFSGGTGTETEPYLISTPTDLAMLALNIYKYDTYLNKYFKQTADINLYGNYWLPIGSNDRAFRGSFDGNGYKIKNALVDNENDTRIGKKVGFFGYTDSAAVKNVCLENTSVIYKNPNMSGDAMGALLIAGCYNNTIVTDCSVQGAIRAEDYMNMIGGLIGYVNTSSVTVTDSFVIGSMTVSAGAKYAGGFWGIDRAINVRNCYSAMEMNLTDNVNYLYAFGCGESDPERNCYYDQTLFGEYTARQGLGEPKTTARMRTAELADLLNGDRTGDEAVWTYDTDVNIGYPYLIGKAPSYVSCTVSFETAHGAKPADIVVLSGSRITEPEILIDAYSIEGWYTTPTFDEGTKFDFDEPVVEDMTLYAKWVPGKLSGSAKLAGNAVYGETLKVNVTDHNNADIGFTYEWYTRQADSDERVLIDGEEGDSYVIGAEDIGKVIVCMVGSKELTGSIEAESAVVEKAVNTNVPDVSMRRPTNGKNSDGRIIGTDATMEYSTTADFSVNVNACSDGETVVAHIGTYYVRYKESATHLAGEATAVTVLEFLEPLEAHFVLGGENSVTYNAGLNRYEYVYTTTAIKPDVMVTGYGRELVVGRDYTITYKSNTNVMAGKNPSIAVVTITGKGNYSGSKMLNFHIIPKDIEDGDINIGGLYVKEGTAAAPTLLYNGYQLAAKDYTLAGSTGKLKASDADPKITVTGKGNFTGTRELVISVLNKTEFADRTIKVATNGKLSFPFDGEPKELEVTSDLNDKKHLIVTNKAGELLKKDEDFILDYSPNVHAGTVKVKVTGIGKYNGTVETKFTITPAKTAVITSVLIDDSGKPCNEFTFDKGKVKPELDVKAKIGDTEFSLVEGVDYPVTYSKNSSVGTGSYKLKLTGDFKGAALAKDYDTSFIISPKKLKDPEIRVGDKTYNVKKKKYKDYISEPIVILDGYLLTTSEYTVSYYDKKGNVLNKNADLILNAANQTEEIKVKIGLNSRCRNYVLDGDEPESTYTVQMPAENPKIDISKVKVTLTDNTGRKITSVQYTGEPIVFDGDEVDGLFNQAVLTVTVGNLKKGGYVLRGSEVFEEFDVIYSNNLNLGTGTIILTPKQGNGQYIGINKSTFKIAKLMVKDHLKVK